MRRTSFARRLQATYTPWARILSFVLAIPVLLWIALFILEAIGGDLMVRAIYGATKAILPYFSNLFHGQPYLYVFMFFLLINLGIIVHADFVTYLPLGLSIDTKYCEAPKFFTISISNKTGDNLKECELELVEMNKFSESTPRACINDYKARTPTKLYWIDGYEMTETITEIKNGRKGIAGVVFLGSKMDGQLFFGNHLPPLAIWPGKNEATLHFSGVTARGDTKTKDIYLTIDFTDNTDLKIEASI